MARLDLLLSLVLVVGAGCSTGDSGYEHSRRPVGPLASSFESTTTGRFRTAALASVLRHAVFADRLGTAVELRFEDGGWLVEASSLARLRVRLPERSHEPIRVVRDGDSVSIAALDVADRLGTRDGSALVYGNVAPATDQVILPSKGGVEELRVLRDCAAPTRFRWRITAPDGGDVLMRPQGIEVRDASARVVLAAETAFAIDRGGARRNLSMKLDGDVLTAELAPSGLVFPVVVDPSWTAVPDMRTVRYTPIALALSDGNVMVVPNDTAPWVDIYEPPTNSWTTGPDIPIAWTATKAIVLADGNVLVVASTDGSFARFNYPARTWTTFTQTQLSPCASCVLARLADGRVLKLSTTSGATELYDPVSATWNNGPIFTRGSVPLSNAVTLDDGRVVVTDKSLGQSLAIYDPSTDLWTDSAGTVKHQDSQLVKLNDGRVMLVGTPYGGGAPPPTAQIWDPAANSWTATYNFARLRTNPGVVVLPNGRAMVIGGKRTISTYTEYYGDAEIWDPTYNAWTLIDAFDSLVPPRELPGVAALPGGSVLVAGGTTPVGPTATAVRFDPIADGASCVAPAYAVACAALYCVDGVCCNSAVCPGGTCSAPEVPGRPAGTCAKNLGQACTNAYDCASGFCVDGVCCDTACGAECEACNLPPSPGTCHPVIGSPQGTRPACDDGAGDPCKARICDGRNAAACDGFANGATVQCAPARCDGSNLIPKSSCDGAGQCVTPPVASCGRYACDASSVSCRADCVSNDHCAAGFFCLGGICSEGAQCSKDRLQSTSTDGITMSCVPYLCGSDGTCLKTCTSSADCARGAVCAVGACVLSSAAPPAQQDTGCGCTVVGSRDESATPLSFFAMAAVLGAFVRARRSRKPRSTVVLRRIAAIGGGVFLHHAEDQHRADERQEPDELTLRHFLVALVDVALPDAKRHDRLKSEQGHKAECDEDFEAVHTRPGA